MIAEPDPTRYDLTFRLGRFPVRVHPLFWLVTLLMGSSAFQTRYPFAFLAIWIAVVFVSILVHELGHALAFRLFGSPARICLYWFGGLAISPYPPDRPGPMVLVSFAGPLAGFVLAGIAYAAEVGFRLSEIAPPYLAELMRQLLWVNVVWGAVNLLPVLPLDGGQACRDLLRLSRVRQAEVKALKVSFVTAIAVALFGLASYIQQPRAFFESLPAWAHFDSLYVAILFGVLAYSSYQALQSMTRQTASWYEVDDVEPWRR